MWCSPWCKNGAGDIDRGRIEPVSELHHNCTIGPARHGKTLMKTEEMPIKSELLNSHRFSVAPMMDSAD
jgi:hypothetical protein